MNNFMLVDSFIFLKKKPRFVQLMILSLPWTRTVLGAYCMSCPSWSYPEFQTQTYPQESYAIVKTSIMEFRNQISFLTLWSSDMDIWGEVFMLFISKDSSGLICVNFYVNSELPGYYYVNRTE